MFTDPIPSFPSLKLSTGYPGKPISSLTDGRRKVIVLPGTYFTQELPELMVERMLGKGMINRVQEALTRKGVSKDDVDICCAIYSHQDETPYLREHFNPEVLRGTHPKIEKISDDAYTFVRTALLPMMRGGTDIKKPKVTDACERLSKLTLVSHSYGTVFAVEVARAFREELKKLDYTNKDIDRICHEITSIAYGNGAKLEHKETCFRTFSFSAEVDISVHKTMTRLGEEFGKAFNRPAPSVDSVYETTGLKANKLNDRMQKGGEQYQHDPATLPEWRRGGIRTRFTRDGVSIVGDLPGSITIPSKGEAAPYPINRDYLKQFCDTLIGKLVEASMPTKSWNKTPLLRDDVVPEHSVQMFTIPTESGNAEMVNLVDCVLAQSVGRKTSKGPQLFRDEVRATIENGKQLGCGGPVAGAA